MGNPICRDNTPTSGHKRTRTVATATASSTSSSATAGSGTATTSGAVPTSLPANTTAAGSTSSSTGPPSSTMLPLTTTSNRTLRHERNYELRFYSSYLREMNYQPTEGDNIIVQEDDENDENVLAEFGLTPVGVFYPVPDNRYTPLIRNRLANTTTNTNMATDTQSNATANAPANASATANATTTGRSLFISPRNRRRHPRFLP